MSNYVCPYCGKEIDKKEILFWEEVKTQYVDNVRGDFLRRHGVRVPTGNRFPRLYYKVTWEGESPEAGGWKNVTREDENGFPTMIEDHLGNAVPPEELGTREVESDDFFDDDFDAEGFDEGFDQSSERRERELHNIPLRACPWCHCDLPKQFGILPIHHVAMFGGRAAGKTAYLVNLFQQIKTQLSLNDLGTADLASESAAFLQPMIDDYEREGTTHPTPADGGLMPVLCHYKNKVDEAFVVFYDIAGEGTGDAAYMANHKGIANCESLMLMIDPNMFVGGAFYSAWTANHLAGDDRYNDSGDCCREPLDSFLYDAGELCREYSDGIRNIICVITKVDMMLEADSRYFSSGDIELLQDIGEKHRGAVSLGVLSRISDELKTYLKSQYRVDMTEKLKNIFGQDVKICVLGVSTSTRVMNRGEGIHFEPRSSAIDPKHRILEPFLAALMYFSLVPARNSRGEIVYYDSRRQETQQAVRVEAQAQAERPEERPARRGLFGRWRRNR